MIDHTSDALLFIRASFQIANLAWEQSLPCLDEQKEAVLLALRGHGKMRVWNS
jgi:hypothetical protein